MGAVNDYYAEYQREYRKRPYVRERMKMYSREYRKRPECQEYARKYFKECYDWYKANGVCVWCHQEKAVPGRVLCAGCGEKSRIRNKKQGAEK